MTRDRVVEAMAKAMSSMDGFVAVQDKDRERANIAFDAMVRASVPKDTKRFDNGTWWAKTAVGEKMVNKITVTI